MCHNTKITFHFIAIICLSMLFSCGDGKNNKSDTDTTKSKVNVNIPDFNADSAYTYIDKQVAFGPRVPNSKAHSKCADYLIAKFKTYTNNVIVQESKVKSFDGKVLNIKNIVASFNPETNNRIFISSHWDSRPFADYDPDKKNHSKPIDGANDGASGVGIIMEIARLLNASKPTIGVDLILFDAEDYGQPEVSDFPKQEDTWCLGSQYWAKNPHKTGYYAKYGILLDMVGAENATFTMEGTSMYYAPDIMEKIWNTAVRAGYSDYFLFSKTGEITDDHLYINKIAKIPTIDIVHRDSSTPTGFFKNWHTVKDDMNGINKNTLKAVGQTLLTVVYEDVNS
ncbi:MAG: M28 family peptidase [Bacteroidales bacterium]